jgi:plasmid stabilization system protein ParE
LSGRASRCLIATIFSAISKLKVRVQRFMSTNRSMPRGACSTFLSAAGPGASMARASFIPRTPYVAAYLVDADTVRILRVLHGAQMWPDEFPAEDGGWLHTRPCPS